MSWFFGKSAANNPPIPATTPLQQQRLKQIKSLQSHNQNVIEIKRDAEYKVTFQSGGSTFSLNVQLPTEFPNEKPNVTITPNCYHPWIDSQTSEVKGCTSLNSFYMHSDLGKIIQQIVKELKKSSPVIKQFEPLVSGYMSPFHSPTTNNMNTNATDNSPSYVMPHKVVEETGNPDLDKLLQELSQMPKSELESICKDPDILFDRIAKMESVENLQKDRFKCIEENEQIAKSTLELEPAIDDLKGDLKESFERYNELFYEFQDKSHKQDELSQFYDVLNILTNLRISVMQSEEQSEKIAEDFITGNTSLDTFLTDFIDKRKETHLRRVKEERMKNQQGSSFWGI